MPEIPGVREVREVPTAQGPGRVHVAGRQRGAVGTIALGHGAGGGVGARDLVAVTKDAAARGWRVLLVEQPWRLAGRRVAAAPPRLDEAWLEILGQVLPKRRGGPLVLGGRSAGAQVACRTARPLRADAVLCLAFPLHTPGRPDKAWRDELDLAGVPGLVVQGERDPFGTPAEVASRAPAGIRVAGVPGDHSLSAAAAVAAEVGPWLAGLAAQLPRNAPGAALR